MYILMALMLALGSVSHTAHADPIVVGDPSKGTPITTLKDGKSSVQITTSGISVDDGDDQDDAKGKSGGLKFNTFMSDLGDILVPGMFFVFLLASILGKRYFHSRNEQRRLDLLKLMVEKGQPVPETVVTQILSPQIKPESDGKRQTYKRTRNAYGFTVAGVLILGYAVVGHDWNNAATLVPGLVFLCLGVGGLAGIYLPKTHENTQNQA